MVPSSSVDVSMMSSMPMDESGGSAKQFYSMAVH